LGSTITTLSVVIPGFLTLTAGKIDPLVLMMTTYVSVNIHYLLPFHHVTIMIGSGNRFIDNRSLLKFGLVMTFVVVGCLLFVYVPWWRFIGLL
jgi:di/tricarboxylate transporter